MLPCSKQLRREQASDHWPGGPEHPDQHTLFCGYRRQPLHPGLRLLGQELPCLLHWNWYVLYYLWVLAFKGFLQFVILSYFKCGPRELHMHLGVEYIDVLTANFTIYFYPKSNISIFLLHRHRKADPDSVWPLGCCDVSGQVRVLHRRGLLHRVGLQRRHSSSVVLEWKAPHYRGQPQQQWVETACVKGCLPVSTAPSGMECILPD